MFKAADAFDPEYINKSPDDLFRAMQSVYLAQESDYVRQIMELQPDDPKFLRSFRKQASDLIEAVRSNKNAVSMIDALMQQYSLNTQEGVLLMCLAEALIRVPDARTADAFIRDRLGRADWSKYVAKSDSLLVNASTWGLLISGKVLKGPSRDETSNIFRRMKERLSEPLIRAALGQAMRVLGRHFVLGENIQQALASGRSGFGKGFSYSFDMLGEAALTKEDAARYLQAYKEAIEVTGRYNKEHPEQIPATISVKLSALHPRFEAEQERAVMQELGAVLSELIRLGNSAGAAITIDAEEADRLELTARLFAQVFTESDCDAQSPSGIVVQAYSKRALPLLVWLRALAARHKRCIPVRLVKGAYWDSEIKHAQEKGLTGYPVFTRKESTDLSYLTCARFLLRPETTGLLYPQFASHNPCTIAAVLQMAGHREFEFQRLHGMGEALYDVVASEENVPVRIYAPVGNHKELLPYLVRRLLENGANTSFVHRLADARLPVEELIIHPPDILAEKSPLHNPRIPLPPDIFPQRVNSRGINLAIRQHWHTLQKEIEPYMQEAFQGAPVINGEALQEGEARTVVNPADTREATGRIFHCTAGHISRALDAAEQSFAAWRDTGADRRSACLLKLADLLEQHRGRLIALCHREAGKTVQDSVDEVREAVDFCRYYALQAQKLLLQPQIMPGPTGESNTLSLSGRGIFCCISPWNFPLAIFTGQVMAALVTGNTVLAKPAEQTSLIASFATELALEAGIPAGALHLLTGSGWDIGRQVLSDPRIAGVAFTGSTQTAIEINRQLAARNAPLCPLIAETGGQNAMIIDSTALPEQAVKDAVRSAFSSAGQRCSALRVLYVQEDIAARVTELLKGAMAELVCGDPSRRETDAGPVIDAGAAAQLQAHINCMEKEAELIARTPLPPGCRHGHFVAPVAFKIDSVTRLTQEHFGPVLHVITFPAAALDNVIDEINATGYGLTTGIHSRNETEAQYIARRINAGNVYINRGQTGAAVGSQPFGGTGLSGTGPKAGGPHYLLRFVAEKHVSINTAAMGGNAALLAGNAG